MAELEAGKPVSLEESMVSTVAMTNALAKLLIEKGVITDAEFKQKLL
jgi:predicted dehydrogenase